MLAHQKSKYWEILSSQPNITDPFNDYIKKQQKRYLINNVSNIFNQPNRGGGVVGLPSYFKQVLLLHSVQENNETYKFS